MVPSVRPLGQTTHIGIKPEDFLRRPIEAFGIHPRQSTPSHFGDFRFRARLHRVEPKQLLLPFLIELRNRHRHLLQLPQSITSSPPALSFLSYIEQGCLSPSLRVLNHLAKSTSAPIVFQSREVCDGQIIRVGFGYEALCSDTSPDIPLTALFLPRAQIDLKQWREANMIPSTPWKPLHTLLNEIANILQSNRAHRVFITDLENCVVLQGREVSPLDDDLDLDTPLELSCITTAADEVFFPPLLMLASCIRASIVRDYVSDDRKSLWSPRGAMNKPDVPLPSEEDVLRRQRHSDFDLFALENDPAQALQFIQWRSSLTEDRVKGAICIGDMLTAKTNGFSEENVLFHPWYPLESVPEVTESYLQSTERTGKHLSAALQLSTCFSIEIEAVLQVGQSMVLRGRMVSIDGELTLLNFSELCIKLYDDSFLDPPEYEADACPKFRDFQYAENLVRHEDAAYRRLELAQGSLFPIYYGAHVFKLANGFEVYGTMMEYIHGTAVHEIDFSALSENAQIAAIQNARHGVRVLQYSDATQTDWHDEQILCRPVLLQPHQSKVKQPLALARVGSTSHVPIAPPNHIDSRREQDTCMETQAGQGDISLNSEVKHEILSDSGTFVSEDCAATQSYQLVFIDLTSVTYSKPGHDVDRQDDYQEVANILSEVGLPVGMILRYYDPRENWDTYGSYTPDFLSGDPKRGPEFSQVPSPDDDVVQTANASPDIY